MVVVDWRGDFAETLNDFHLDFIAAIPRCRNNTHFMGI